MTREIGTAPLSFPDCCQELIALYESVQEPQVGAHLFCRQCGASITRGARQWLRSRK